MAFYGNRRGVFRSFGEIDGHNFTKQLGERIKSEIENLTKEYILGVDEQEYTDYLVNEYSIEPLTIDYDSETIEQPSVGKEQVQDRFGRGAYQVDVYHFTIKYNFTGSAILFKVRPTGSYIMRSAEISVDEKSSTVSLGFSLYEKDPEKFKQQKSHIQTSAFTNLGNTNRVASQWNASLKGLVSSYFQNRKARYLQENDFFAAINVKVDKDTSSVFTAPTVQKKVIPKPTVSDKKEFSSEPMMSSEMYSDVLKVIYDFGKGMERKPSTYLGKDEEAIRDQFLLILETRYDSTTASGETFNKGGKTDIILKYSEDGTNLFVAECKFWHGGSEFQKAISQLFDRYLTWRDSKAALLLFVNNQNFTKTLETIEEEAAKHPYFQKSVGKRGASSFSYHFRLPKDLHKTVHFEIIAFHFEQRQ